MTAVTAAVNSGSWVDFDCVHDGCESAHVSGGGSREGGGGRRGLASAAEPPDLPRDHRDVARDDVAQARTGRAKQAKDLLSRQTAKLRERLDRAELADSRACLPNAAHRV